MCQDDASFDYGRNNLKYNRSQWEWLVEDKWRINRYNIILCSLENANHSSASHTEKTEVAASGNSEPLCIDIPAATINVFISMPAASGREREEEITFCLQDRSCCPPT